MASQLRSGGKKKGQQTSQQKRLVLIAVLGVIFVVVLYIQFFSGEADPDREPSASAVPAAPPPLASATAGKLPAWTPQLDREYPVLVLKSRPVEQIIERHALATAKPEVTAIVSEQESVPEPMAVPMPVPEPMPTPPPEPLLVRAVYATPTRGTALVGQTIVRDGEVLPNGRKLVAASPLGLTTQSSPPVSTDNGQ